MQKLSVHESNLMHAISKRRLIDRDEWTNHPCIVPFSLEKSPAFIEKIMSISKDLPICIVGDYDVDGAVSAALLLQCLQALGFLNVKVLSPQRMSHGYGLSPSLVMHLDSPPGIIITVDNGIKAIQGVKAAQAKGWFVIVTDHHLPGDTLPGAELIINPKINGPQEATNLAGVGVVYYLLKDLYAAFLETQGELQNILEANPLQWIDLVALGTIADMVILDKTNRALVMHGIFQMRRQQGSLGIQTALEYFDYGKKIPLSCICSQTISLQIAPLINAAGRLADIQTSIQLLTAKTKDKAKESLQSLLSINGERKRLQNVMRTQALQKIDPSRDPNDSTPIVLYDAHWHVGLIGIIASQLKNQYQTIVAIFGQVGEIWRGSIRSVSGWPLSDFLETFQKNYPEDILQAGGHALAAGVSLRHAALLNFQKELTRYVAQKQACKTIEIRDDGVLAEPLFCLRTLQLLNTWIPWGNGCPEPLFRGEFLIVSIRTIQNFGIVCSLQLRPQSPIIFTDVIWASQPVLLTMLKKHVGQYVTLWYCLSFSSYQSKKLLLRLEKVQSIPASKPRANL